MDNVRINEGKELVREVNGTSYERHAIRTHVISNTDNIVDVVKNYAVPHMKKGDILFMSEKAVACTQNRAIPMDEIHPRPLARFLVKFVYRSRMAWGVLCRKPWKLLCSRQGLRVFCLQQHVLLSENCLRKEVFSMLLPGKKCVQSTGHARGRCLLWTAV